MPEMQDDHPNDPANPALDEFVDSVEKVNEGLSDMISCALRMQMLMIEDARNMMAEFSAISAAAGARRTSTEDT